MSRRWLPLMGATVLFCLLLFSPTGSFAENFTLSKPAPVLSKPSPSLSLSTAGCSKFTLSTSVGPSPGKVGSPYRYQIKASDPKINPTYKVTAGQLPTGLKVDTKGLIQGVPVKAGHYKFTIQAAMKCTTTANRVTHQFVLVIQPRDLKLSIRCQPKTLTITTGKIVSHTLDYLFSSSNSGLTLYSAEGHFRTNKMTLGKVATPMVVTMKQPTGHAVESLAVPAEVIRAAQKLNARQISYTRAFKTKDQKVVAETTVNITIALEPTLNLQGLSLNFGSKTLPRQLKRNKPAKATILTNQTPPPLFADVLLSRPGVFSAFWQINGKPLTKPTTYKANEKRMVVAFPDKRFPLAKLAPGEHSIQFVITTPKMKIPEQKAVLVVEATEPSKPGIVKLQSPEKDSELAYKALSFKWSDRHAVDVYRIEFSTVQESKTFFSATSKERVFHLKGGDLKHHFTPGKGYFWQVKGLNAQKKVVSQSTPLRFVFKPLPTFMSGQIVVTTEATPGGRVTLNRLIKKYQLKTIETTAIRTLKQTATVFGTHSDVRALVQRIRRERGVIQVQANNLFRTMAEPQNDLQQIFSTLNLPAVHQRYQGKGVRIAIVDTGVDIRHPDLKQRVTHHANLIRNSPYRAEIHGTALAGVMAASINNYGITGIAPQAEIIALRACWQTSQDDPEGTCTTLSISKAIDMAIESDTQIVNMSFGAPSQDPLMKKLLNAGAKKGVLFVAPVGNQKNRKKLPFPASHSKVLSVGGWDGNHAPYPNAELAKAADVCAPSGNIFTTIPGKGHNFLSGTSISAAIVSGILAVAKEKNRYLGMQTLPAYNGDLCRWQEKLINRPVCSVRAQ